MNIIKSINRLLPKRIQNNKGFFQAILPALKTAGSFALKNAPKIASAANSLSGFFGGGSSSGGQQFNLEPLKTAGQLQSADQLSNFVNNFIGQFTPGKEFGNLNLSATDLENTGLTQLGQLLNKAPTGAAFKAGKGQILDTLGGKFLDPNTNPFISAMTSLSKRNVEDQIDASRARSGARGKFFSTAAIEEEGRLRGSSIDNLNALIGGVLDKERGRQFSAAPIAQQFDQFENLTAPLARVGASQSLGSLQRIIDQGNLERNFVDFQRKQKELGSVVDTAGDFFGTDADFGIKSFNAPVSEGNSSLQNILGMVNNLNLKSLSGKGNPLEKVLGLFGKKS